MTETTTRRNLLVQADWHERWAGRAWRRAHRFPRYADLYETEAIADETDARDLRATAADLLVVTR